MWVGLVVLILSGKICYHCIERYWFSCNFVLVLSWTCSPCLKFPAIASKFLYVGLCHLGVRILGTFPFLFAPLPFYFPFPFWWYWGLILGLHGCKQSYSPSCPSYFSYLLLSLCLSTVLRRSSEGKYICIAPDFRGNAFSFPHFVLCWPRAFLASLCALSWST